MKFLQEGNIRKSVGAIVVSNNKILLVRKIRGGHHTVKPFWGLPRGGISSHEKNIKAALRRELFEETGSKKYIIGAQFSQKTYFDYNKFFREKSGFSGQEVISFLVEYTGDGTDLKPDGYEIDRVAFFTYVQALKKITRRHIKKFLKHPETVMALKKYISKDFYIPL